MAKVDLVCSVCENEDLEVKMGKDAHLSTESCGRCGADGWVKTKGWCMAQHLLEGRDDENL